MHSLSAGDRLGRYEIATPLGMGGFGEVYRAHDTRLERDVAIKVLPKSLVESAHARKRFEREARAVAALSHPNILAIHDFGEDRGNAFAVMELVPGETLRALLADGPLSVRQAIDYGAQISRGLAAAHERGVLHRDLKPENVIIDSGQVKIIDFGLAKIVEPSPTAFSGEDTLETKVGTMLGTVGYMAPEQAKAQAVDPRADIFSLGCILYEMLSGRRAFHGDSAIETLHAVVARQPQELTPSSEPLPPGLVQIVFRCLEKRPESRFQTASDLGFAIEAISSEVSSGASAAVGVSEELSEKAFRSIAVLPFADMSADQDQDYFSDGMAEDLVNALTKIPSLKVAGHTSASQVGDLAGDPRRVGQELGVELLLEGSVRRAGEKLRVTARLLEAATGYNLWSERYDRTIEDIFDLQDEITSEIVDALKIELVAEDRLAVTKRKAYNVAAYHLFLQGRYYWNHRFRGGLQTAMTYFERALDVDPDFAPAHAGLSVCYSVMGLYDLLPPPVAFGKARSAAQRAVDLEPESAAGHMAMGLLHAWDWDLARQHFEKALEIEPDRIEVICWYALARCWRISPATSEEAGRAEIQIALEQVERALEIDPRSPYVFSILGFLLRYGGDQEGAIARFEQALEADANYLLPLYGLGLSQSDLDRHEAAIATFEKVVELSQRMPVFLAMLGRTLARAGQPEPAREIASEIENRSESEYVSPTAMLIVLLGLADVGEALVWLDKLFSERSGRLGPLWVEPMFALLKTDARSLAWLKQRGFL